MLKLYFSVCFALIGGVLTVLFGLLGGIEAETIAFRAAVASVICSIGGYFLGMMAESFLQHLFTNLKTKGQNIDIMNRGGEFADADEPTEPNGTEKEFSPFTPDSFDRIPGS